MPGRPRVAYLDVRPHAARHAGAGSQLCRAGADCCAASRCHRRSDRTRRAWTCPASRPEPMPALQPPAGSSPGTRNASASRSLAEPRGSGLGWLGIGLPRGHEHDVEGRRHAALGIAELVLVDRHRRAPASAGAAARPRRRSSALPSPIRPSSRISRSGSAVAHGDPVDIDHRQREARPLQQRAGIAHVREGRDPQADAAFAFELGLRQRLAQLGQGLAAGHGGEQQPIGRQAAAQLRQRAGQVVDPVQHHRAEDEIEPVRRERQRLGVGDDAQAGAGQHGRRVVGRHQQLDPGPVRRAPSPPGPPARPAPAPGGTHGGCRPAARADARRPRAPESRHRPCRRRTFAAAGAPGRRSKTTHRVRSCEAYGVPVQRRQEPGAGQKRTSFGVRKLAQPQGQQQARGEHARPECRRPDPAPRGPAGRPAARRPAPAPARSCRHGSPSAPTRPRHRARRRSARPADRPRSPPAPPASRPGRQRLHRHIARCRSTRWRGAPKAIVGASSSMTAKVTTTPSQPAARAWRRVARTDAAADADRGRRGEPHRGHEGQAVTLIAI